MQITPTLYRIPKKVVISMTETEKKYDASLNIQRRSVHLRSWYLMEFVQRKVMRVPLIQ